MIGVSISQFTWPWYMWQLKRQFIFTWRTSSEIMLSLINFLFFNFCNFFLIKWDYSTYSTVWHLHYGNAHKMPPFLPVFLHFFYWNMPSGKKKSEEKWWCVYLTAKEYLSVVFFPQKDLHFKFYQKNNFCLLLISLTFQLGEMRYFEVFSILPNHLKICQLLLSLVWGSLSSMDKTTVDADY